MKEVVGLRRQVFLTLNKGAVKLLEWATGIGLSMISRTIQLIKADALHEITEPDHPATPLGVILSRVSIDFEARDF